MQSQDSASSSPISLSLALMMEASKNLSLLNESLYLLSQKRRTLEEKTIASHFHRLSIIYAQMIEIVHKHFYSVEKFETESNHDFANLLTELRTVNEKLGSFVSELLKILKYDFNFLEQYFEYDYCGRLLNEVATIDFLESSLAKLESLLEK